MKKHNLTSVIFSTIALVYLFIGFASGESTNALIVTESGNVGIGVTNPIAKLEVTDRITGGAPLVVQNTDPYASPWTQFSQIWLRDGGAELMKLRQDGRLWVYGTAGYVGGSTSQSQWALQAANNIQFRGLSQGDDIIFSLYSDSDPYDVEKVRISSDGSVGIGTSAPNYKLDIAGDIGITGTLWSQDSGLRIKPFGSTENCWVALDTNSDTALSGLFMKGAGTNRGYIAMGSNGDLDIYSYIGGTSLLKIKPITGNVGIGTTNPTSKLEVSGGDLRVTGGNIIADGTTLNVPDYIFEEAYEPMPLSQLREYINRERHLPNIPNARDIKEKGLNITQFQMKLLEKVEELTLHILDQQEQIKTLQARLAKVESRAK